MPMAAIFWLSEETKSNFGLEAGTVGDMFGAANSLFSGLAAIGLLYTIRLQQYEIEEAKSEQAKTLEALKDSARANSTQVAITAISALLEATLTRRQITYDKMNNSKIPTPTNERENLQRDAKNATRLIDSYTDILRTQIESQNLGIQLPPLREQPESSAPSRKEVVE